MKHDFIENNIGIMIVLIAVVISFGGLAEIPPLFFLNSTTEAVDGLEPLSALELEGRDIYIREGCHVCHTQMIRPFRAETERYGHYTVAGEHVYEHPFLWGSKRTGPDLARVGGRYSDDWHRAHLYNPRDVVPESNMPSFPWLFERSLNPDGITAKMAAMRALGVPYADADLEAAPDALRDRSEADALVAYLQQLGTVLN
ncbi:MAG: cytochrome-c oxidase, cbb3-type subunit II [Pseudomonadota bacterium]|nr:cytochrome-c oxidase, cbb3-type subunit II [Pseudomonadota bacterium]